jgi:hypothetical protein
MHYVTIFYWIIAFFTGLSGIKSEWKNSFEEGKKQPVWKTFWAIVTLGIIFYITKNNVF